MAYDTPQVPDNQGATPAPPPATMSSEKWLKEIKGGKKFLEKFHTQGDKVVERYLDERPAQEENTNKVNLFTTNVGILISTLYARLPKPMVTREYEDPNDDVSRVAAIMLERMLKVNKDDDVDTAMKFAVQDRLVPGAGAAWLRYDAQTEKYRVPDTMDAMGQVVVQGGEFERIVNEKACVDYVYWKDIIWSPTRIWALNRWVARRVKLTKEDATKRFGEMIAGQLKYMAGATHDGHNDSQTVESDGDSCVKYAEVWEIWSKTDKMVIWVSEGCPIILDQRPPLLMLDDFWPCPKPLMALTATKKLVPRSDYLMVQDQYRELDELNNRIMRLEKAVKVVGVFDNAGEGGEEITRIFTENIDNRLIPLKNFRRFAENGGFKGSIDWIPIDQVIAAIEKLRVYRQDLIAQIYELTGISDIMRGATKASETLGAQQLKAQYGSVKLQFLQMDVASFLEQMMAIKVEIIRNHFQPQTIIERSNIMQTEDAQYAQQAIALLKSPLWKFKIQVHADSMAVPDFTAEQEARMQYVRAISEYLVSITPIIQSQPTAAPFLLKIMAWAAASFRSGREIEGVLDQMIAAAQKLAAQPPAPPQPDPKTLSEIEKNKAGAFKTTQEGIAVALENQVNQTDPTILRQRMVSEAMPPAPPTKQ